jgi:hypothetical protein
VCVKTEDGYASLISGAHQVGEIQMFEAIVNSKQFFKRLQSGNAKAFEVLWKEEGVNNVVPHTHICVSLHLGNSCQDFYVTGLKSTHNPTFEAKPF